MKNQQNENDKIIKDRTPEEIKGLATEVLNEEYLTTKSTLENIISDCIKEKDGMIQTILSIYIQEFKNRGLKLPISISSPNQNLDGDSC